MLNTVQILLYLRYEYKPVLYFTTTTKNTPVDIWSQRAYRTKNNHPLLKNKMAALPVKPWKDPHCMYYLNKPLYVEIDEAD